MKEQGRKIPVETTQLINTGAKIKTQVRLQGQTGLYWEILKAQICLKIRVI